MPIRLMEPLRGKHKAIGGFSEEHRAKLSASQLKLSQAAQDRANQQRSTALTGMRKPYWFAALMSFAARKSAVDEDSDEYKQKLRECRARISEEDAKQQDRIQTRLATEACPASGNTLTLTSYRIRDDGQPEGYCRSKFSSHRYWFRLRARTVELWPK